MGELAARSGIRQPSIWAIEHEKFKKVKFDTLFALCSALGVQMQDVLKQPSTPDPSGDMAATFRALNGPNQEVVRSLSVALLKAQKKK